MVHQRIRDKSFSIELIRSAIGALGNLTQDANFPPKPFTTHHSNGGQRKQRCSQEIRKVHKRSEFLRLTNARKVLKGKVEYDDQPRDRYHIGHRRIGRQAPQVAHLHQQQHGHEGDHVVGTGVHVEIVVILDDSLDVRANEDYVDGADAQLVGDQENFDEWSRKGYAGQGETCVRVLFPGCPISGATRYPLDDQTNESCF